MGKVDFTPEITFHSHADSHCGRRSTVCYLATYLF